ncbi:hypothetical protein EYF80_025090 [Liparis tanakae]|uniref:Uncharacterized protein n=1 Tax=Liparis tanakae TaxID=230148 RepID=A0A4Z2HIB3_9TELE|nr:hypothetical protein EYF80_025090 [Liparis tanakae]
MSSQRPPCALHSRASLGLYPLYGPPAWAYIPAAPRRLPCFLAPLLLLLLAHFTGFSGEQRAEEKQVECQRRKQERVVKGPEKLRRVWRPPEWRSGRSPSRAAAQLVSGTHDPTIDGPSADGIYAVC